MPDFWPQTIGPFVNYGSIAVGNKKVRYSGRSTVSTEEYRLIFDLLQTELIAKETVTQLEVLPEGCSNSHVRMLRYPLRATVLLYDKPTVISLSQLCSLVQFKAWEANFTQSTARNVLKIIRVISRVRYLPSYRSIPFSNVLYTCQVENMCAGPVVVMDEYSGITRASILAAVDVMSALIYKAGDSNKNQTVPYPSPSLFDL